MIRQERIRWLEVKGLGFAFGVGHIQTEMMTGSLSCQYSFLICFMFRLCSVSEMWDVWSNDHCLNGE